MIVHSSQPIRALPYNWLTWTVGLRLILYKMTISHILLIPQKRGSLVYKAVQVEYPTVEVKENNASAGEWLLTYSSYYNLNLHGVGLSLNSSAVYGFKDMRFMTVHRQWFEKNWGILVVPGKPAKKGATLNGLLIISTHPAVTTISFTISALSVRPRSSCDCTIKALVCI